LPVISNFGVEDFHVQVLAVCTQLCLTQLCAGIVNYLKITVVGCNLKQFDGLT